MNITERKAYNWLIKHKKINENNIIFQGTKSPDFILTNGDNYEVKKLYGRKIIFYRSQINSFEDNTIILLFKNGEIKPFKILKWKDIKDKKIVEGLQIVITERTIITFYATDNNYIKFYQFSKKKQLEIKKKLRDVFQKEVDKKCQINGK